MVTGHSEDSTSVSIGSLESNLFGVVVSREVGCALTRVENQGEKETPELKMWSRRRVELDDGHPSESGSTL